jgi:predicted 3-demethylubiquinone-9 3-methyltransferase (glyoxalase superfamily)
MAHSVRPFLMFQENNAEEAMNFYVSLFSDGKVIELLRFAKGEQGPEGSVKTGVFSVAGQTIRVFDSPVKHAFTFTPASSLFVECESEAEIARLAAALAESGNVMMPLDNYGFSRQFTWVSDRYGVSWQLNLK